MRMEPERQISKTVTAEEVAEAVGPLEDATVATIIATGASREEVLEAYAWLSADDDMHRELHRAPHGVVAAVCDILEAELMPVDDGRE